MDILVWIIAGFCCLVSITVIRLVRNTVDDQTFTVQIRKLIMANNIDRAIKLCNAVSSQGVDNNYPEAVKSLLVRANRMFELYLEFRRSNMLLDDGNTVRRRMISRQYGNLVLGVTMAVIAGMMTPGPVVVLVVIMCALHLVAVMYAHTNMRDHDRRSVRLMSLYITLCHRAKITAYDPWAQGHRVLSEAELSVQTDIVQELTRRFDESGDGSVYWDNYDEKTQLFAWPDDA